MSNVYFIPVEQKADIPLLSEAAARLLAAASERESFQFEQEIPLKVHFGEKGNRTYLKPGVYNGIIDFLKRKNISCRYIETSVLYGGERFEREKHIALALSHGFDQIPITIADGEKGEDAAKIEIDGKYFKSCAVASGIASAPQIIVLSHFKGHMLAGFGGAIKQLSMGCASKGGKMAMHMGVKPRIRQWKCKRCKLCQSRCNEHAITIGEHSFIDHEKCVGCGACFSICPHKAVSIFSLQGFWNALFRGKFFREKLVEYAFAAQKGKRNLYLNFAVSVTKGCDCEPRPMLPCIKDIGIFASTDPVAVDSACWDAAAKAGKRFKGVEQLAYAESLGLGSRKYTLIQI